LPQFRTNSHPHPWSLARPTRNLWDVWDEVREQYLRSQIGYSSPQTA
jgi:hypothetical protein